MSYRPKYFRLEELVSEDLFNRYSSRPSYLWGLLDSRLLITIDRMRERFGVCIINNWRQKGSFQHSGFRDSTSDVGVKLSQHRFGRGADLKFARIAAPEVQEDILKNSDDPAYEFVTCVERNTPTWTHIDCRTHYAANKILWVGR